MLGVLRDGIWQFAGAIFALAALCISLWIFHKQKARKRLAYTIVYMSLLDVHQSLKDELQIVYRGHPVSSAYMARIIVANKGNVPITRLDFDEKVSISLQGSGELVLVDTSDNDIHISKPEIVNNSTEIEPFLLNESEEIVIKAIVINGSPGVILHSRIIGGTFESVNSSNSLSNSSPEPNMIRSQIEHISRAMSVFTVVASCYYLFALLKQFSFFDKLWSYLVAVFPGN